MIARIADLTFTQFLLEILDMTVDCRDELPSTIGDGRSSCRQRDENSSEDDPGLAPIWKDVNVRSRAYRIILITRRTNQEACPDRLSADQR